MHTLATLQQRFQIHVTSSPDAAADGLQDDVRGHLEVYVNAYWGRLREALADNYPVLNRALGDDGFRELAAAYVSAHPSHFRSIRWFGDRLADFIAGNPEIVPHPALLDIARLDWAMRGAFDAAKLRRDGLGGRRLPAPAAPPLAGDARCRQRLRPPCGSGGGMARPPLAG